MTVRFGKGFWLTVCGVIMLFTVFVVGRNLMHAWEIRREIRDLERRKADYEARIEYDSVLMEGLRYDDRLEKFARERYMMKRPNEKVYIVEQ